MEKKEFFVFEVNGLLTLKGETKNFSKKVKALNEKNAVERVLTLFGSKNRVKRRKILVKEVKKE